MTKQEKSKHASPPVVPKKYAGKWIAWDHDGTNIIASGDNLENVLASARDAGELEPGYEWIPPADVRIVGAW